MESTPVGVIVGLFAAISQKLPALQEWESRKHGNLLGSNPAVCDALTEVRQHLTTHGESIDLQSQTEGVQADGDFRQILTKSMRYGL